MAFIPCPGIASVTIQVAGPNADIAENILHFYKGSSAAWTAGELTTLANTVDTWVTTGAGGAKYTDYLVSSATVQALVARDLTTQTGPEITKIVSHAGGSVGTPLPAGITKALTLRSGLVGRSNRGRVFQPFLPITIQASANKDAFDATSLTNLVALWTGLIAAIPAANASWTWVVLSRSHNLTPRAAGVAVPITEVGYSHIYFDYQRRRAPAHARHH